VEICGFNDWLLEMLRVYGCREAVLIQPEKRSRKKTDRRDASSLSQLLWVNRQRVLGGKRVQGLKRIILPSQGEQDNRQLTAWRQRTAALRTRTINKVQHILLKHNLQQECPTKGMKTKKARHWLTELRLGEVDRLALDQLLAQWEQPGQLLGPDAWLPQLGGCHRPAGVDHQRGKCDGPLHSGSTRGPRVAARCVDESVVCADQEASRVEDCSGSGDASAGDDYLAHGQKQRAVLHGWSSQATAEEGGMS
jgi:hypothetical protein